MKNLRAIFLAAACFLLPFAVYLATLAPTLSWRNEGRDGGDLVSAICTLGIPHPPGYPTYMLLGRLFALLPIGDAAYRANLMSAFFAAAAVLTIFLAAGMMQKGWGDTRTPSAPGVIQEPAIRNPKSAIANLAAALALAFSPTFWSQATIAEVYTLSAFFGGLILCLVLLLMRSSRSGRNPGNWLLLLLGLTAGLSLGNHLAIAIWLGAVALWLLMLKPAWLWRSKSIVLLAGGFLLGLAVYLYLPLRAAAHPANNWGDPQTLAGFLWVVTGEPYRGLVFAMPLPQALGRIPTLAAFLAQQFGWVGLALGLAGVGVAAERNRPFLAFSAAAFLGAVAYAVGYNTVDSFVYLIPAYQVFALWIAVGAGRLLETIRNRTAGHRWRFSPVASGLLLVLVLAAIPLNYGSLDAGQDRTAYQFAAAAFTQAAPDAILLVDGDEHTFALWYYRDCVGARPDVAVLNRSLLGFDWYQAEMRRLYPHLAWPRLLEADDPVGELIAANLGHRLIYLTEQWDAAFLARFPVSPDGSLYRLEERP